MAKLLYLASLTAVAFGIASCCCGHCLGTGEIKTQYSQGACPYCGGSGGWTVSPTPFSDQEW